MRPAILIATFAFSACATAPPGGGIAAPTGARIEPSGYATILSAPPAPYVPPPRPVSCWERPVAGEARLATDDFEILDYRCMRNIPLAQARAEIMQLRSDAAEAQQVAARLRAGEPSNFVGLSIQRLPVAAWRFAFKREPEATLRRYTSNPRFVAAREAYTPAEQEALRRSWGARLAPYAVTAGAGAEGVTFTMSITEQEFRALPQYRDFRAPPGVRLDFPREPDLPAITADAAPFVRIFPRQRFFPGIILTGLMRAGPITLRDGCLFLGNALVRLNRTAGLFRDAQGYLAIRDRADPCEPYVRIGEKFAAASPNGQPVSETDRAWITSQCGNHPIVDVYSPSSAANWDKWVASQHSDAVPVPPERRR